MSQSTLSAEVLEAFGISAPATHLAGGRSLCFIAGDVVLKPSDEEVESQWVAQLISDLRKLQPVSSEYQVARPIPVASDENAFVYRGWTAWSWLPGEEGQSNHWADILRVSQAFHRDLARLDVPKPSFIGRRLNRWQEADLVTWDEKALAQVPSVSDEMLAYFEAPLRELWQMKKPLPEGIISQLIHGDISGNILFDDQTRSLPGVIDMTFYWRPASYAEAIVVADGLAWHGQGRGLIELYGTDEVRIQLLVRALYWRCITFAIDTDLDWARAHISEAGYHGAARILRDII
ncbi:hypothetical protein TOPH_08295 [Tolypocladium ophioglossoides CBS 100239]|uniref:Uncharacterized protein n=1 Tax=Tolypocladium ophioglossoides (strain CBS 100239) TaxID=1163406 RepID=A0A0L0MYW8_TOLOC|nr:hypothetical protein TOPH_08295 [Tolypocladium ophioglossoides CBS 100239]